MDIAQKSRSTKEVDELCEGDTIEQVMEDVLKEKKDERDEKKKKIGLEGSTSKS